MPSPMNICEVSTVSFAKSVAVLIIPADELEYTHGRGVRHSLGELKLRPLEMNAGLRKHERMKINDGGQKQVLFNNSPLHACWSNDAMHGKRIASRQKREMAYNTRTTLEL